MTHRYVGECVRYYSVTNRFWRHGTVIEMLSNTVVVVEFNPYRELPALTMTVHSDLLERAFMDPLY